MSLIKMGRHASVIAALLLLAACSGTKFEGSPTEEAPSGKLESASTETPATDTDDPDQLHCTILTDASTKVVFDDAQSNVPASDSLSNRLGARLSVKAQRITTLSNFSSIRVDATAGVIDNIENFTTQLAVINAKEIGHMGVFAAQEADVVAHSIDTISNFAAGLCVSAQNIGTIENLAGKVSLYGRNEGGVKAKLANPMRNMASFVAVYDFDIPKLETQAIIAKFVNSHIGEISGTVGTVKLVNTDVDDISHFAGIIHLKGTSKVGNVDKSRAKIIHDDN